MKWITLALVFLGLLTPNALCDPIGGGYTTVTFDPAFINLLTTNGLTPTAIAPAMLSSGVATFPITGGTINGADAVINHDGGLTFTHNSTFLSIGNFVIDTAAGSVSGFAMNSEGLDLASAPLFDIGPGVTLSLTGAAAGVLSSTFFDGNADITKALTGFTVGTADPQPTPVPEPTSLFLLGSGLVGFAGMSYRRIRQDRCA